MSVYAVFEACGKQHKVTNGQVIKLDKIEQELGATVTFDKVLLVQDGESTKIGTPAVSGHKVVAEVVNHGRDKKIDVIKFKRRKNYIRKIGHRAWYTEVKITDIGVK